MKNFLKINRAFGAKKKIFFLVAFLSAGSTLFAQTELVDFSKITTDSWGQNGNPVVTVDAVNKTIEVEILAAGGFQWGNQAKITLTNVAESGLDKSKEYQMSFTATSTSDDCSGVTLKTFDNNQLFYRNQDISLSTTPFNYESEWVKLGETDPTATNGTIVFDFGWDPAQTVTISNLSFKVRDTATAIENAKVGVGAIKVIEDGQLFIIKNGVRYDATGQVIR